MIRVVFAVKARPDLTRAQALEYLRDVHGPLVAATSTVRTSARTYIHNHSALTDYEQAFASPDDLFRLVTTEIVVFDDAGVEARPAPDRCVPPFPVLS